MPVPGSTRSRWISFLSFAVILATPALAQQNPRSALVPYRVEDDGIVTSLTGSPGDPARGAVLFASRQISTCLLCHADPSARLPAGRAQDGTIGPSLADVGSRLTDAQIRLRIVDAARVNPDTVMPSFYVVVGLNRVGRQWRDKPILDAWQIEDLVAFLRMLRKQ